MKHLNELIFERLKLTKNTKLEEIKLRDLSNITVPYDLILRFSYRRISEERSNKDKMQKYYDKGSKPRILANSIQDPTKLIRRWLIAIFMNWEECYDVFRREIINRGLYSEDQLDAYILKRYNMNCYGNKEYYEKYLAKYNVKIA